MSNRFVIKDTSVEELMSVDTTGKLNVPIAQGDYGYKAIVASILPPT